jgi:ABC-2 type transport system ATP-binding protein
MKDTVDMPVLSLRGVTKKFGSKAAVKDANLEVKKGEIFGFLGPNGAGKTTTIRMILDVLRPTAGEIFLFGRSSRETISTHGRIGYLSGDMVLDDDLTGGQYLSFVDHRYGGKSKARMHELAEVLHLDLRRKIGTYSRGNKQKVGLISALMHEPELLVLDEPTSGFDPLVQEKFMTLIQQFQGRGGTVFMSSHIISEVQRLCDRVAFIRNGQIVSIQSVEALAKKSTKEVHVRVAEDYVQKLISASAKVTGLKLNTTHGNALTFTYTGDINVLLKFFAKHPLADLTIEEPELEQIFMSYYENDGDKLS